MNDGIVVQNAERDMEADPLWDFNDVSAYIGIPVPTLRRWRTESRGPSGIRMGKHVRFRRSTVTRWVEEQEALQAVAR